MQSLDELRRSDPSGMYDAVLQFPQQWAEGRTRALQADLGGLKLGGHRYVVVAGMGGSAIGGDLLRTLALGKASVPVFVSRSYTLPAWVGTDSLVIVSSYSGNTEETLSAMNQALERHATTICVSSGGDVLQRASERGLPAVRVPGGMQPRAALGYSLTALLTIAERIGLLDLGVDAWDESVELLERQAKTFHKKPQNEARQLAEQLQGRLPFVYSGEGLMEAVNLRWCNQIQENAKTLSSGNLFPELNHNEIMGWEYGPDIYDRIGVVVLRDRDDHPRVQQRMEITRGLLERRAGYWTEIESRGESALARVLSLIQVGDWVSLYLALLNGVDPTPVGLIQQLKETLQDE